MENRKKVQVAVTDSESLAIQKVSAAYGLSVSETCKRIIFRRSWSAELSQSIVENHHEIVAKEREKDA